MIATAAFLPFTRGDAVRWSASPALFLLHKLAMAAIVVVFYGAFWTRQGHTLGMASWRLRVERNDGERLTWSDTLRRLLAAVLSWLPAGLGWVWCLFDREHRTWHDTLSRTRVIVVPKHPRS
jgi:uncharacterized RDD family membrane protein YckC